MASEKRQRQDQLRAQKLQVQETQAKKETAAKKRNKFLLYGGLALVLIVVLSRPWTWTSGDDNVTTKATAAAKPVFTVGTGTLPTKLVIKDLVVGTGPEVKVGGSVSVKYVGKSWSTNEEFDSNWAADGTFDVSPVGSASVIKGWNEGLVGMKQGGRRQLTIPPDLAYGKNSPSPKIKADETLVFVIDAVSVK